jgi:hypothetical protein
MQRVFRTSYADILQTMHNLANMRYGFLAAAVHAFDHPAQSAETVPCLPRVRGMHPSIPRKSIVHFSIFKYIQCMTDF